VVEVVEVGEEDESVDGDGNHVKQSKAEQTLGEGLLDVADFGDFDVEFEDVFELVPLFEFLLLSIVTLENYEDDEVCQQRNHLQYQEDVEVVHKHPLVNRELLCMRPNCQRATVTSLQKTGGSVLRF
jgi:hypothetical protein